MGPQELSSAEYDVAVACWQRSCRIVIYHRHVEPEKAKHFQLALLDPNDGHYAYSAIVTNRHSAAPPSELSWRGAGPTSRCTSS